MGQLTIPGQSPSPFFVLTCHHPSICPFTVRFDDAYLAADGNSADVGVELSSCTGSVELGGGVAYSAVVRNLDAFWSVDVDVLSSLPGSCRWNCAAGAGAFCTTGLVAGPLSDSVFLPALGSVTYDITCLGATGAAATVTANPVGSNDPQPANNVASLSHTVVAAGAGPHVKGDLTGDMQADLVLRQNTIWNHAAWEQVGSRRLGTAASISPTPDAAWYLEGVDDFDGDHRSDLVFRDPATRRRRVLAHERPGAQRRARADRQRPRARRPTGSSPPPATSTPTAGPICCGGTA